MFARFVVALLRLASAPLRWLAKAGERHAPPMSGGMVSKDPRPARALPEPYTGEMRMEDLLWEDAAFDVSPPRWLAAPARFGLTNAAFILTLTMGRGIDVPDDVVAEVTAAWPQAQPPAERLIGGVEAACALSAGASITLH